MADLLGQRHGVSLTRRRLRSIFGRGDVAGLDTLIVKPQTFMNDSGDAARRLVQFFKIEQANFLVIYDDMALDLGVLRVRRGGSDAGHKGIRSVARLMGTTEIQRLRLGVGQPPAGVSPRDWVLSEFKATERAKVEDMVQRAADAAECWLTDGMDAAMNRFNG